MADWHDWRNPIKVEEYGAPLSTGPKIKITPRSGSLTSRWIAWSWERVPATSSTGTINWWPAVPKPGAAIHQRTHALLLIRGLQRSHRGNS